MRKLYDKKRLFVIILAFFQMYNFITYPLVIAFKWNFHESPFLMAMEIMTIIIYTVHLVIKVINLK